jgi:DNA-binding CsgD family transcriptional regulator
MFKNTQLPLTSPMRIRNYSPVSNDAYDQIKTRGGDQMTNDSLRYEIARLDAKVDLILNHIMNTNINGASNTNKNVTSVSTGELALLRGMTVKQHCALQLVECGLRNQDIAQVLNVAENTVKQHVRSICRQMGVKNRAQAATVAHDIFANVDPSEYERLSGGIPLSWASQLQPDVEDSYYPLYAPTRKDG